MLAKIVSGGQTGVDRAALDVAIELGIPHGGWVPKGRRAEDGMVPEKYSMKEMRDRRYAVRTEQNVIDSDGTLIISRGKLKGGSALTRKLARRHGRPWLHIDVEGVGALDATKTTRSWIARFKIGILNVAGPRASQDPEIYGIAEHILRAVFCPLETSEGSGKRPLDPRTS